MDVRHSIVSLLTLFKPKELSFACVDESALIRRITVVFNEKASIPYLLDGVIDLVTGNTDGPVLFTGALEVSIEFQEKALV